MADQPPERYRTAAEILQQQANRQDDRSVLLDRRQSHTQPGTDQTGSLPDDLAAAALRAKPIFDEFGSAPPSRLQNEDAKSYRLRIIDELRRYSSKHGNVRLRALADLDTAAFDQIESEILANALEAGRTFAAPGTLRERRVERADGIPMTEFVGSPLVWLSHFMRPAVAVRRVRIQGVDVVPSRGYIADTTNGRR